MLSKDLTCNVHSMLASIRMKRIYRVTELSYGFDPVVPNFLGSDGFETDDPYDPSSKQKG